MMQMKCIFLFSYLTITGCSTLNGAHPTTTGAVIKYSEITSVSLVSKIDTPAYKFSVISPNNQLSNATWRRFRDNDQPINTTLVTGSPELSYVVSVTNKGEFKAGKDAFEHEAVKYAVSELNFKKSENNNSCVLSTMNSSGTEYNILSMYVAVCLNEKTHKVYELVISERNKNKSIPPPEFTTAMLLFFKSFAFK